MFFISFLLILVGEAAPLSAQTEVVEQGIFACSGSELLFMSRKVGVPPQQENYWKGTIDFDKSPSRRVPIEVELTFDALARIEIDPHIGYVYSQNDIFRIEPVIHNVTNKRIEFTVRGVPHGTFPNVVKVAIDGSNVCPNPKQLKPILLFNELKLADAGSKVEIETKTKVEFQPEPNCGKRIVNHQQLITNGFPTQEGDWPWHSAIYHLENLQPSYKCGGTLINMNTVITAAHCLYEFGRPIIAERVIVQLGKWNLELAGPNTQEFRAYRHIIHNKYSQSDLLNDIGLIRLATEATFTPYVQPICLWDYSRLELSEVLGKNGVVVGWGFNEHEALSRILNQATMPVVSATTCLASNRNFFGLFLSDDTFCAGYRNGTGVCNGDSGGGMYFERNGIYSLRGIVSLTVSRSSEVNLCDPQEYVVFTDAARYLDWIRENSK